MTAAVSSFNVRGPCCRQVSLVMFLVELLRLVSPCQHCPTACRLALAHMIICDVQHYMAPGWMCLGCYHMQILQNRRPISICAHSLQMQDLDLESQVGRRTVITPRPATAK